MVAEVVQKNTKKDGVPSSKTTNKTTNVEPSCISLTTFFWVFPYLISGYLLNLNSTNMPSIFQRLGSKANCEIALEKINEKMKKNQFTSIKSVIFQHGRFHLVLGIMISIAQGILNNLGRPLVLKLVIDAAMPESNLTEQEVVPVVILFGIVIFLEGICTVQVRQVLSSEYCSTLVSWLVPVIHQKSMRIAGTTSSLYDNTSKTSKKNIKEGPTSNNESAIIGNDIIRGFEEIKWTCGIVQHSVGLISGVVALFFLLGWTALQRPSLV